MDSESIDPAVKTDSPRRRLSITRTDRQTTAGLELLTLLQEISDDGRVAADEVDRLREWLAANPSSDLPAREYLNTIIADILRDGVVTDEEFGALYEAIERVLPPDLRILATARRRERRANERAEAASKKAATREQQRKERERDTPIETADFMIAGATRSEYRDAVDTLDVGHHVWLQREPDNAFDSNAIQVLSGSGLRAGYVPREFAADLASVLDGGARQSASIKKLLQNAKGHTIPVVLARLYSVESALGRSREEYAVTAPWVGAPSASEIRHIAAPPEGVVIASSGATPTASSSPSRGPWLLIGAIVVVVIALFLLF